MKNKKRRETARDAETRRKTSGNVLCILCAFASLAVSLRLKQLNNNRTYNAFRMQFAFWSINS